MGDRKFRSGRPKLWPKNQGVKRLKKRFLFGLAVCFGMLLAGSTTASAQVLCHDDPTLQTSVPGVSASLNVNLLGSNVFATSAKGSTSFGFTVATP